MSPYTVAWLVWIASFVAIEGAALKDARKGDTLSEHIRSWFGVTGEGSFPKLRRVALVAGLAWLSLHLITRGYV